MSIEAMKQALEALEADEQDMVADKDGHMVFRVDAAITALRQALASVDTDDTSTKRVDETGENVHEPVAWADDCRIELVTAIHMLSSDFENALYAFRGDTEARKSAEGSIAHALGVAVKWNRNGRTSPPPRQQYNATADHQLMENAQGDLERVKLVQTGVGIGQAEQAQPVGEVLNERGEVDWISFVPSAGTHLYTAPPHRQPLSLAELFLNTHHRKPLSDEQIRELTGNAGALMQEYAIKVARAIEAAHGIKGEA